MERWCAGRLPYSRNRVALAALVGRNEHELWPTAGRLRPRVPLGGEIRTVYPHRWAVPRETWLRHFSCAEREIGILAHSALFLAEDLGITRTLAGESEEGVKVRLLLGDPDNPEAASRGDNDGNGDAMAARIRKALVLLRPVTALVGVELRLHRAALYNSIYRADDELLITPHIYGQPAVNAPVLHVRPTADGMLATPYVESFERTWLGARVVKCSS